jgi:hypothetical protein
MYSINVSRSPFDKLRMSGILRHLHIIWIKLLIQ